MERCSISIWTQRIEITYNFLVAENCSCFMRSALFSDITQHGLTYEDITDTLSRKSVNNYHTTLRNTPEERRSILPRLPVKSMGLRPIYSKEKNGFLPHIPTSISQLFVHDAVPYPTHALMHARTHARTHSLSLSRTRFKIQGYTCLVFVTFQSHVSRQRLHCTRQNVTSVTSKSTSILCKILKIQCAVNAERVNKTLPFSNRVATSLQQLQLNTFV
jgi:hypothetical protein